MNTVLGQGCPIHDPPGWVMLLAAIFVNHAHMLYNSHNNLEG